MANIFTDLRHLSSVLHLSSDDESVETLDDTWYSDKVYLVHRNPTMRSTQPRASTTNIDTLCCIAALIYVNTCLCNVHFHTGITGGLVPRLKVSIEKADVRTLLAGTTGTVQLTLWALFFGGIAAVGGPERTWFVAQLATVCDVLGLNCWTDVERVLASILWTADWEMPQGSLWKEVEEARRLRSTLVSAST